MRASVFGVLVAVAAAFDQFQARISLQMARLTYCRQQNYMEMGVPHDVQGFSVHKTIFNA